MAYCQRCGGQVAEGINFCPNCGADQRPAGVAPNAPGGGDVPPREPPEPPPGFDTGADNGGERQGLWDRFLALPIWLKVLLAFLALALAVAASPVMSLIAVLAVFVSLLVLLARLFRRRPAKRWGLTLVASFLLAIALTGVSDALYGTPGQERAAAPEATTEKRPEPTKEEAADEPPPPETAPEETTTPPPRTYKEKVDANLAKIYKEDTEVLVETAEDGCKSVTFNYSTPFVGSTIPSEPPTYFEAVYKDDELRQKTCRVKTNAYGDLVDKYGKTTQEVVFTASLDRETAEKINWKDTWNVDFASLQRVEYMHPEVKANIEQEGLRNAADCAQDGGLFDFDFGC